MPSEFANELINEMLKDRKYLKAKVSLEYFEYKDRSPLEKIPDEIVSFFYFDRGDYDRGVLTYQSFNWAPSYLFFKCPQNEVEKAFEMIKRFNPGYEIEIKYAGYDGDDFIHNEYTAQLEYKKLSA